MAARRETVMGLFLALSGIAGVTTEQVEKALAEYATKKHGVLEPAPGDARPEDVMVVAAAPRDRVTVVYPGDFMGWDEISAHLSHTLQKPVLSFHIHDGDFWMYTFFANGNEVDWFNPVPEYWGDISDEETRKWVGNVGTLCQY